MPYRRLGRSGLKVSLLGLGSWVTFGGQLDEDQALACMEAARGGGINFFDNAESYGGGEAERLMGRILARAGWPRHSYVVSTKFFWGIHPGVNTENTLNRKYLLQAIEASLSRLQLDFVDLVFCHRPDPTTPIEETVWAMHDIVQRGRALYWGTSDWSADELRAAYEVAERHHLHKPIVEQPEYSLLHRRRVEVELARVLDDWSPGLTTWSPLASGVLTGKYLAGIPEGSRLALADFDWLRATAQDPRAIAITRGVVELAAELGCTPAQLAIAWCARNPRVSSVITGASRPDQVVENLGALTLLGRLGPDVWARLERLAAIPGAQAS